LASPPQVFRSPVGDSCRKDGVQEAEELPAEKFIVVVGCILGVELVAMEEKQVLLVQVQGVAWIEEFQVVAGQKFAPQEEVAISWKYAYVAAGGSKVCQGFKYGFKFGDYPAVVGPVVEKVSQNIESGLLGLQPVQEALEAFCYFGL